jgi:hypothetical protein
MSHQTRQTNTFVTITDLNLLARAVNAVQIESLETRLVLHRDRKEARYWGEHMDNNCFAVIGYARELTPQERQQHYEIAVKEATREINGVSTKVYDLVADVSASDRTMEKKISVVFEQYQIAVVFDDVPPGFRKIRCVVEN